MEAKALEYWRTRELVQIATAEVAQDACLIHRESFTVICLADDRPSDDDGEKSVCVCLLKLRVCYDSLEFVAEVDRQ
jgi:hypothetical protein